MFILPVAPVTSGGFELYGWVFTPAVRPSVMNFTSPRISFSEQHIFNAGPSADTQVLWVTYRARNPEIQTLEMHKLCQQSVVPLTGQIVQIVAVSEPNGTPDLETLRAFRISPGQGICMRPGCWHTTRVEHDEVNCLMLTRRSTTQDLIAHLQNNAPLSESQIVTLAEPCTLARNEE